MDLCKVNTSTPSDLCSHHCSRRSKIVAKFKFFCCNLRSNYIPLASVWVKVEKICSKFLNSILQFIGKSYSIMFICLQSSRETVLHDLNPIHWCMKSHYAPIVLHFEWKMFKIQDGNRLHNTWKKISFCLICFMIPFYCRLQYCMSKSFHQWFDSIRSVICTISITNMAICRLIIPLDLHHRAVLTINLNHMYLKVDSDHNVPYIFCKRNGS